jgi:hypothetical protein
MWIAVLLSGRKLGLAREIDCVLDSLKQAFGWSFFDHLEERWQR